VTLRTGCGAGSNGTAHRCTAARARDPHNHPPEESGTGSLRRPPGYSEYIASRISTNIRELEGALIRVTAFASLNRQSDLQLAEIVLKDLIRGTGAEIHAATIMGQTASYFGLSIDDLCGLAVPRPGDCPADRHVPVPRLTDLSLPESGSSSAAATTPP
jgi:chromosomal replication initiator protein